LLIDNFLYVTSAEQVDAYSLDSLKSVAAVELS